MSYRGRATALREALWLALNLQVGTPRAGMAQLGYFPTFYLSMDGNNHEMLVPTGWLGRYPGMHEQAPVSSSDGSNDESIPNLLTLS